MRKWRYKYSELWYIQTGEKLMRYEKKAGKHQQWNIVRKRVLEKKWRYLDGLREKELEKERKRKR